MLRPRVAAIAQSPDIEEVMVFLTKGRVPKIPNKAICSWIFDGPKYDVNKPHIIRPSQLATLKNDLVAIGESLLCANSPAISAQG
jgi:hypothetical protein